MLGPSGRRPVGGTRRRRPPLLLVLLVLVAALVIGEVTAQVVGSSRALARRSAHSFVAAVAPLVDESNALVPVLARVRTEAPSLTRTELDSLLAELTSGSAAVVSQFGALELAPPTPGSGRALAAALDARARASVQLAGALGLATSAGGAAGQQTALLRLEAVADELGASDADYRRFRRSLPPHLGAGAPPASVWMTAPRAWRPASLSALVAQLASRPGLGGTRRVALVAVSLEPSPIAIRGLPSPPPPSSTTTSASTTTTTASGGRPTLTAPGAAHGRKARRRRPPTTTSTTTTSTTTTLQLPPPGSVSVVPATRHLVVTAVVVSTGTLAARDVQLSATLTPAGSAPGAPATVTHALGTLAPGAARFVRLPAFAARPGTAYGLVVTAGLASGSPQTAAIKLTIEP